MYSYGRHLTICRIHANTNHLPRPKHRRYRHPQELKGVGPVVGVGPIYVTWTSWPERGHTPWQPTQASNGYFRVRKNIWNLKDHSNTTFLFYDESLQVVTDVYISYSTKPPLRPKKTTCVSGQTVSPKLMRPCGFFFFCFFTCEIFKQGKEEWNGISSQ